jgi:hypothetical protein
MKRRSVLQPNVRQRSKDRGKKRPIRRNKKRQSKPDRWSNNGNMRPR